MRKPRVGVLTNFCGADQTFSLVVVVKTQLHMLTRAGYRPVLFVAEEFNDEAVFPNIEIRKVAKYDAEPKVIVRGLNKTSKDIEVMLCHDLVFLGNYRNWGTALRKVAETRKDIAWIHWQHSRGDSQVGACERSWYAYPNRGDLAHCAHINRADLDHVRYVPHMLDFDYLGWPDLAVQIAEETGFPFADVSCILPTRMDRQKQVEKAVRLIAGIKKNGRSVCFLIADAYATGEHFIAYKKEILAIAKEQGLNDEDVVFLGSKYDECHIATPRQVVKALYEMSNLFIQCSNAETSSLVVMEAALAGNLLVINADFPPIHHLYQKALALPFGSVLEDTKYYRHIKTADGADEKIEDPQQFWDDQARLTVLPVLNSQINISVKRQQLRERWPSVVFKSAIEPLIREAFASVRPEHYADTADKEVTAIITTLDNLEILKEQTPILLEECGHVIVVNNGSKDGTREWLEENSIKGLSYINRENKGAGPGRNAGLDMWANSTPYTLMVDGGILPVPGAVKAMKDYLTRHPEVHVISPEVASCFVTDRNKASAYFDKEIGDSDVFLQSCLSSTAFALCRAEAWVVRFSEEGAFGEPGWGVDDNDMAYRWNDVPIYHRDFSSRLGIFFYRRAGGSFQRLYEETGIWPNQYGSVYEQRNVYCWQEWAKYHRGLFGKSGKIERSYIVEGLEYPALARTIKRLHNETDQNIGYEIIVIANGLSEETKDWIEERHLRFHWGDTVIDKHGEIIHRNVENEALWTGDFRVNKEPRGEIINVEPE